GSENRPLDKWGSVLLLAKLLGRDVVLSRDRRVKVEFISELARQT
ncbi:MAG: hypothetical protein DFNUSKGM_001213, partial [Candidatus Fervidibacter sacchari]